ncbi:MAG: HIT domain-containing protein [Candidatus Tectomicrobia bacterium]|uniref:HIT domain-containing protein n=1 Tax=Tectimicrobiota bacterium TaxID=2528274 RepID=A0A932CMQ1_UNCTE|nr:HIT domain-containing protein [Candidatus Tectomicrobia bacterium]
MQQLWSPWRMAYIQQKKAKECVFCTTVAERNDAENYILHRGTRSFVIMNRYPYNPGHLMVAPYRHVASLQELEKGELLEMILLTRACERVLREAYRPQGFNVGINIGEAAGAGIADHLHLHIVPRWHGDTNFLAVLGETKSLPETLEETYRRLQPLFLEDGRHGDA